MSKQTKIIEFDLNTLKTMHTVSFYLLNMFYTKTFYNFLKNVH